MHEFVDESFQSENSHKNILSIQVSLNGFSFSIVDSEINKLLYFKEKRLKISNMGLTARHFEDWCQQEPLLKAEYLKKKIITDSRLFTLVPIHLYDETKKEQICSKLFDSDKEIFIDNDIEEIQAKLIFGIHQNINEVIQSDFNDFEQIHPLKQIISSCSKHSNKNEMCLYFSENNFTVAIFKQAQLLFVNNFEYHHINDVVYYLLTVLKEMKISTKTIKLNYTGNLHPGSGLRSTLKKYFPKNERLAPSVEISLPLTDKLISENISLFL
jgi:hypothetical protein